MLRYVCLFFSISALLLIYSDESIAFRVYGLGNNNEIQQDVAPEDIDFENVCRLENLTIQYWVDEDTIPENLSLKDVQKAIETSIKDWQKIKGLSSPIKFVMAQSAPNPLLDKNDDTVVITWTTDNSRVAESKFAVTDNFCAGPPFIWENGADIYLNAHRSTFWQSFNPVVWSISKFRSVLPGVVYLPGVLAHEFGHVLALSHSEDASATMRDGIFLSLLGWFLEQISMTSIEEDDLEGIQYLYGNQIPQIVSLEASTQKLFPGDSSILTLVAFDYEGDEIAYRWKSTDGNFIENCKKNTNTCTWRSPDIPGNYSIEVGVSDKEHDFYNTKLIVFTVSENNQNQFLSFIEGDPGTPGDGRFVESHFFTLETPIPLSSVSDTGFTVTVFTDLEDPFATLLSIGVKAIGQPEPCNTTFGNEDVGFFEGTTVYNNIEGHVSNVSEGLISVFVDLGNIFFPGCNLTVDNLFIYELCIDCKNQNNERLIDAVSILPGQNAVPE